jgi:ribosomal-protein-alanine N-acetyltransferase
LYIFDTQRLIVRRYSLDDAAYFHSFTGNAEVMRYIRPVISRGESDVFLNENIRLYDANPGCGRWAVFEKASGSFIGSFSILVLEADKNKFHIGYALLPAFWGLGYASELLQKGVTYFFSQHKCNELYAITQIPNTASQNVLLKAGFKKADIDMEREKAAWCYIINRPEIANNE